MKECNILGGVSSKHILIPPTYFKTSPNSPLSIYDPEDGNKIFLTDVNMLSDSTELQTDMRTGPVEAELQRRELPGTRRESDISYDDASETRM